MRKSSVLFFVLFFTSLALSICAQTVVKDRYIVRFAPESSAKEQATRAKTIIAKKEALNKNVKALTQVLKTPTVKNVLPLWITNSVALNAYQPEIDRIKMLPNVAEVIPVVYEKFVDTKIKTFAAKDAPKIQWGVERVKAPQTWEELKIDGSGVVVGIVDTGIYAEHAALKGKVLKFKDFTKEASPRPHDGQGHGSHVAGTVAGADGVGVAPGARFVIAKVFDSNGGTTTDALLNAMQWMIDPDDSPATDDAPRVINNSWGSSSSTSTTFWDAVQSWVDVGIVPVFAAGNSGPWGKVGTPGAYPHSWAVAATTDSDELAYFSSQGPVMWNDEPLTKPDIAAPGSSIISCSHNSDALVNKSGTSMAAPHVTGVVALMFQADPTLTIEQIRLLTEEDAIDLGESGKDNKFGSGLIDAYASVKRVIENARLASVYEAYENALHAERALIGVQIDSPLVAPLATSIIQRTAELDDGEFMALSIRVNQTMTESAQTLLKEAATIRAASQIRR